jgi:hypothetical protein
MKKKNLYIFITSLSLVGYAWLAWNIFENTRNDAMPTICMFKAITHLPCPSCGTTRSLILLARGEVWNAIMINPFGLILALALVIIPLWIFIDILRKRDSFFRSYISAEKLLTQKMWLAIPAITIVLINWFWNIVKGF